MIITDHAPVTLSLHKLNTRWSFNMSHLQLFYWKQEKAVLRGTNILFSVFKKKKKNQKLKIKTTQNH